MRNVLALERDAPGCGRQHARQQIDQGGLAGPIGANQRVARTRCELQVHILGGHDAPKLFHQALRRQHDGRTHDEVPPRPQRKGRNKRSRPTSTKMTNNKPIQNIQYCGVTADNWS